MSQTKNTKSILPRSLQRRKKHTKKIYVVDYGIMMNPDFAGQEGRRQDQMNRDLTINEIRATIFDAQVYEMDTLRRTMHLIASGENP